MSSRRLKLTFPVERIREPIIGTLARKYDVMPNIRRARITEETGECVLELTGEDEDLEKALTYLEAQGVVIEPVTGDFLAS